MKQFLFDTADVDSLKRVWGDLKNDVNSDLVEGITTNPAIFQRASKNSLNEWLDTFFILCDALTEIKEGATGTMHIQFPNSQGSFDEIKRFVNLLADLYGVVWPHKIILKVPPSTKLLKFLLGINLRQVGLNVTGLSEAGTLLKLNNLIDYASLIPGRMLQAGLKYEDHLAFATQNSLIKIITGALRNYEQVATCFQLGSVPTIGLKTWDLIIKNKELDKLLNLEYSEIVAPEFMPPCDERHTKLSTDFFKEMDEYGAQAYEDFKNL